MIARLPINSSVSPAAPSRRRSFTSRAKFPKVGAKIPDSRTSIPLGPRYIDVDYSFFGANIFLQQPFNCVTWAVKAAGLAWVISKAVRF